MKTIATISAGVIALLMSAAPASAQTEPQGVGSEVIVIEPLFEYPVPPDSIQSLFDRSNYLVTHFWDRMDFKSKTTVDQNALTDAFQVWVSPMRWADADVTEKAVDKVLDAISRNPATNLQFTRAAEESLYGPRAVIWSDGVYLRFVNNLLASKKVPDARKERYRRHKTLLENSRVGDFPKRFEYTTPTGNPAHYQPDGVLTVIQFGDPGCDECRYAKLKLETDVTFSDLVDRGIISMLYVIPDPEDGWQTQMTDFPSSWHIGASDTVSDIYDIRTSPSFYVIGRDGKILGKNLGYREAMNIAVSEANKAPEQPEPTDKKQKKNK